MKFLIIRLSSIGDIVLTTPVIRCLKKQIVTADVHFLTKKAFGPLVHANPYIDKSHFIEESIEEVIDTLKQEDYDYIIDLHHNVRTMKIKKALKKNTFSFNKLNIEKWIYVNFKWNPMPAVHIVDRYMQTVERFGIKNDGAGLDYFIPPGEKLKETDIPASHHAGYIAVAIGAALNTKKYPLHKLQEFCRQLEHPVILLGGKEDQEDGSKIAKADPVKIYNACGKFTINESADLVRRAKLLLTNDTGLMHIAAALKRPVISLWGNTVPEFGMYPYYGENYLFHQPRLPYEMLEVKNLYCRPCSKIGYRKCPLGHFRCMENIKVETVLETVRFKV